MIVKKIVKWMIEVYVLRMKKIMDEREEIIEEIKKGKGNLMMEENYRREEEIK